MRIGVKGSNPLEAVAIASGLVPEPLVLGIFGMGISRVLAAAMRLDVFEALAEGPLSAEEVASRTSCDSMGMECLLNALCGFGYLRRRKGSYTLTRSTRRWLLTSSAWSLRDAMMLLAHLCDRMGSLEDAVRTGRVADFHAPGQSVAFWQSYMKALASFARIVGGEVVRRSTVPRLQAGTSACRLLDVGGGHGMYSVAFCRRYPNLTAEVLDLPEAVSHGRVAVAEAGFPDRVLFREGNFHEDVLGTGFDVVLIFNVLHNVQPEQARILLKRAFLALNPGGTLIVADSEHRDTQGNLDMVAGFNELLFFMLNGTRAWPEATLQTWMAEAGFTGIRRSRLRFVPEILLAGQKVPVTPTAMPPPG